MANPEGVAENPGEPDDRGITQSVDAFGISISIGIGIGIGMAAAG